MKNHNRSYAAPVFYFLDTDCFKKSIRHMMNNNYVVERNKIANSFSHKLKVWENDFISGTFNLVSAGLLNYLPQLDCTEHEDIFRNILLHQRLSILEQEHLETLDCVTCEEFTKHKQDLLRKGGAIICTFHTGSYRIINQILIKHKISFTLVVAKSIIDSQGEQFASLYKRFSGNDDDGLFGLIDAESPSSGLQMLREIKKGRNLVLYIDGNSGAGNNDNGKDNLCDIRFLSQRIFARKGIAFLSHIARAPILTVACYRKSLDDIRLRFFAPIYPDTNSGREIFSQTATQKIYDFIAPLIAAYPDQWEGWLYLHKVANIVHSFETPPKENAVTTVSEEAKLILNMKEYGVFKMLDDFYLFKKSSYTSFVIDKDVYSLLRCAISKPVRKKGIDAALFTQLYENNVFVTF
jgi:lauroyl/myristoyl acyltransferase